MGRYNVNFELSVEDMELIENALRDTKSELSQKLHGAGNGQQTSLNHCEVAQKTGAQLRRIHDLLGRLHNQKVFYRPRSKPYVSG